MSSFGNRPGARKLSSIPPCSTRSKWAQLTRALEAPVRSPSEAAEPLRRKTSIAIEEIEPSFDPGRLSHHYNRNPDVEYTPFGDNNRVDSEDSENEHTSDEEEESGYSVVPSTIGQALDAGSHEDGLPREHGRSWERPERSIDDKEITPPACPPGIESSQLADEVDLSTLKQEELITLVNNLQSKLCAIKNMQRYELTNRARRKSPADLVNDTKALRENVSTWADRYFRHEGILSKDTGKRLETLKVIVDEPEVYIKDSFLRTRLIQARLWDLLQYHVFDDDRKGERKYYGHIWTGGRAKRTWLKDAVTKENEQVDRDMRPLDDVLRPKGKLFDYLQATSHRRNRS